MLSSAYNLKKRFYAGCQPRHPSECLKCRRYHWVPGADSPYLPGVGVIPFRVSNSPSNYPARAQYSFYVPLHETFWLNYIICDTLRNINSFPKFASCFITLISVLINSFYNLYPILFYGNPALHALASVFHQVLQEDWFPMKERFKIFLCKIEKQYFLWKLEDLFRIYYLHQHNLVLWMQQRFWNQTVLKLEKTAVEFIRLYQLPVLSFDHIFLLFS